MGKESAAAFVMPWAIHHSINTTDFCAHDVRNASNRPLRVNAGKGVFKESICLQGDGWSSDYLVVGWSGHTLLTMEK